MADPFNDPSDDWELASIGGIAGATYGGAGMFAFMLRSANLQITEKFTFCACGIGMGGNASGFSPDLIKGISFSPVNAAAPFALRQVHLSSGKLASSAVGVGPASYGKMGIDSVRSGTTYFTYFSTGASVGSGAGAFVFVGMWYSFTLNNNSVNPIPAYIDGARQTFEDIASSWSRGFQNLIPH